MEPDTGSVHSTLRRKTKSSTLGLGDHGHGHGHGGGSTSSHRQSLAFELAAAMEPEATDQMSILDRLGLDDDEDGALYEEEEYEYGDSDEETEAEAASLGRPSGITLDGLSPARGSVREPGATPSRSVRRASRSTINTLEYSPHAKFGMLADELAEEGGGCEDGSDEGSLYGPRLDEEGSEADEEDGQVLEAGLEATAKFLRMLKQANVDFALSASAAPGADAQQQQQQQPDRQPVVEKLVAELVRTMAEQVRDREGQIRELREMEIALARTDRRVLAELDALPAPDDEEPARPDGGAPSLAPPQAAAPDAPARTGTPLEDLSALKVVTTSLIDSLNQIHEHTQVNRQTQTEVVRKLKGVRALVTNWKSEHESVESSKELVGAWEREHGLVDGFGGAGGGGGRMVRGLFEVEINLAVSETEKLLEDGFELATKLLSL